MAPYLLERDVRVDRAQDLLCCQGHVPNIAGMNGERNAAPNPPSWETLLPGLRDLTLSLRANRTGPLAEGPGQQQEPEQICHLEKQQVGVRMFQRMLK